MNCLLAVPWDQRLGGVSYVVGNLAEHLRETGHGVLMAFPGEPMVPEEGTSTWGTPCVRQRLRDPVDEDRPVRSRLAFAVFFPVTLALLVRLILRREIDVVNVHYPTRANLYHALAARLLGKPFVVSVHGSDVFPDGEVRESYQPTLRWILSTADAVVCPSDAFRRKLVSVFPGLSGTAEAVHNGISVDEFRQWTGTAAPAGEPGRRLLCVAAHVPKKGLDVLLEAVAGILERGEEVHVTLVGRGPLSSDLRERAAELGVAGSVEFRGTLDRQDVIPLMRGADALVLPSRSEPFGLVAAEAMLAGTPVVASRVGGLQEIVVDGETGCLVEPERPTELADAMLSLIRDPDRREAMGRAARDRVSEHFTADRTGERYTELYARLLGG